MTTVSGPVDRRLLAALVAVADGLELEPTLRRIVLAAAELTTAQYAALGVLGEDGLHRAFVHAGMDAETVKRVGSLPRGRGVLGHITRVGRAVRLADLSEHPASTGFPAHHPPMTSFLGVPVGIGDRVVGNLYLADKPGGFTAEDEDVVVALAAAAAVAVDNAQLYEDSRRRTAWIVAAQQVATAMLSGADEEEALALVAGRAREIADADVACLVLPGWGGQWVLEVVDGEGGQDLVGTVMLEVGRAVSVIGAGEGSRTADLSTDTYVQPVLRRFGPALYAPMIAGGEALGVLLLLRLAGGAPFSDADLVTAQAFAGQAALALNLGDARRRAEDAEILEERQRIARDLHDLVVQELFALGMRLSRLREAVGGEAASGIDASLESLDRVVRQIRSTIRALRDPEEATGLAERVQAEATRARTALGFPPEVIVEGDAGHDALPPDLADDVIAVVREGLSNAARHARATSVTVRLMITPDRVAVEICDDGLGLPEHAGRHSGLDNLDERARRHSGGFTVRRRAPSGTGLHWQAPLRE